MKPPPRCSGQLIKKRVSYCIWTGLSCCKALSFSSKLEVMRPSQPPSAPAKKIQVKTPDSQGRANQQESLNESNHVSNC
jgi:hypothetical protein